QEQAAGLDYWQQYLEGYDQPVVLPGSPAKMLEHGDYRVETYYPGITHRESRDLNRLASAHQVTVNTLFQALWGILLQKYNNCDDAVFAAVVSGRPPEIAEIEKMVGLFINTVPVRVKTRQNQRFSQLLENLGEGFVASKAYEYLQLADIQARSQLKEQLINHLMVFENYPFEQQTVTAGPPGEAGDFTVKDVAYFEQSNYHFNIVISPTTPLTVKFIYNALVYEPGDIKRIACHLKEIPRQVLNEPGIKIRNIQILTKAERKQVLFDFNRTVSAYPVVKTL
ncbi:MAG: non-ribosomal peptide synthetase, partial [bacterium]|nr:non-ribosomal peptide synthetase [bacterium]